MAIPVKMDSFENNIQLPGCFQNIGVPQNGWFTMENPIKMDDLGGPPLFLETPIYYVYPGTCEFVLYFVAWNHKFKIRSELAPIKTAGSSRGSRCTNNIFRPWEPTTFPSFISWLLGTPYFFMGLWGPEVYFICAMVKPVAILGINSSHL